VSGWGRRSHASRLFLRKRFALSPRVWGSPYLLSNLGGIVGAILAAMWILPTLGTLWRHQIPSLRERRIGFRSSCTPRGSGCAPSRWPRQRLSSSVFRFSPRLSSRAHQLAPRVGSISSSKKNLMSEPFSLLSLRHRSAHKRWQSTGVVIAASEAWDPKFPRQAGTTRPSADEPRCEIRRTFEPWRGLGIDAQGARAIRPDRNP